MTGSEPSSLSDGTAEGPTAESATPLTPDPLLSLRRGQTVANRFRLESSLGKGMRGVTWCAAEIETERKVALKFLGPDLTAPDRLELLRREVESARALDHPGILRTGALLEDLEQGVVAVEMELGGTTLGKRRMEQPQRWFETVDLRPWIEQILAALSYAHGLGVSHGDLRPSDLFVSDDGVVKIGDFGLRPIYGRRWAQLGTSDTSGALGFASLQRLEGGEPSPSDDVYSLGAILYFLLSGQPPFRAAAVDYQIFQLRHEPLPTIRERRIAASGSECKFDTQWDELIGAMLARDGANRPSVNEISAKLVPAPSTGARLPDQTRTESKPLIELTSGTVAVAPLPPTKIAGWAALVGVLALGAWLWHQQSGEPRLGRLAATPASPAPIAKVQLKPVATPSPPQPEDPRPALINSLGMRLVSVPGIRARICVWPTRIRDFQKFAQATGSNSTRWQDPGFPQTSDHPVVNISWDEAKSFCTWLTKVEQEAGTIAANEHYRLCTDAEWSRAVGLVKEEGETPEQRDISDSHLFPWGTVWPPPLGVGNYSGQEGDESTALPGYEDPFPFTAPVGSFPANRFGLYDMGGNVWQWVEDDWNATSKEKTARGASWSNGSIRLSLLAAARVHARPEASHDNYGFRIVLDRVPASP